MVIVNENSDYERQAIGKLFQQWIAGRNMELCKVSRCTLKPDSLPLPGKGVTKKIALYDWLITFARPFNLLQEDDKFYFLDFCPTKYPTQDFYPTREEFRGGNHPQYRPDRR